MKKIHVVFFAVLIMLLFPCISTMAETPIEEKVGVLITGWGMPAGYNEGYAFKSSDLARIGDRTEYIGQPCKIGHVGEFPYISHINMIPWGATFLTTGWEIYYDYHGIYKYENGMYISPIAEIPSVNPASIPAGTPITPLKDVVMAGTGAPYPIDPRDGTDYLAGWYRIGSFAVPFINNYSDFMESMIPSYIRYYGLMSSPTSPPEVVNSFPQCIQDQDAYLHQLLEADFGDRIDIRGGYYTPIPGITKLEDDVAEEFSNEGFTKLVLARETTDHNRYANEFMTGNYIKERLCELGTLGSINIQQARQVGRTPEFNTMNIRNLQRFIQDYPAGSTIGLIYVTRGLPWYEGTPGPFGVGHPWYKEVYHENAYLNYLSWKKAIIEAFGNTYNLVFTAGDIPSDLRSDNFYAYGVNKTNENNNVFKSIRDVIQTVKQNNIYNILIVPCHWNYDNLDTIVFSKEINRLPMTPKSDVLAGIYDYTHCEDAAGGVVACESASAVSKITFASSYTDFPEEFSTAYYVVLRGTLERFGLYPAGESLTIASSQLIEKLAGGTTEVTDQSSPVKGAKIIIPADPYSDRPESFTASTAVPVNDPANTSDCLWEDTVITIGQRVNPPAMQTLYPAGPAVHFGPYRTFFNRDVTITIPYNKTAVGVNPVNACIYNHVTEDWDVINPITVDSAAGTVSFKTQVLGLFQVASSEPTVINLASFTAKPGSQEVLLAWTTESEIDNSGFNLYRAYDADGPYTKINEALVPAKGTPTEGASYTFTDTNLQNRKTCYYKLEDVALNGVSTKHGPVNATPRFLYGVFH